MDVLFESQFYQSSSQACLTDITAPTFSGITGLTANINGSLTASWSAATDATTPIEYDVYVQAATATGLFSSSNLALITPVLSAHIYVLNDLSRLVKDITYFVGVRARDAVGNVNTNTTSLSAMSTGVLDDDLASLASKLNLMIGDSAADLIGIIDDSEDIVGSVDESADIIGVVDPEDDLA